MTEKKLSGRKSYQGRRATELPAEREILLLRPLYSELGDVTQLVLTNGEERIIKLRLDAVLDSLAKRRNKDLRLLRAWAERITHQRLNNPLAISHKLVLAPFRAREAKVSGDTVMGFVNVAAMVRTAATVLPQDSTRPAHGGRKRALERADSRQRWERRQAVLCIGSLVVQTLWSLETAQRHLLEAQLVYQLMMRELEADLHEWQLSIA